MRLALRTAAYVQSTAVPSVVYLDYSTLHYGALTQHMDVPVLVGWAHLDKCHIERHNSLVEQLRDLTEKHRGEIRTSLVHSLSHITSHKQGDASKDAFAVLVQERSISLRINLVTDRAIIAVSHLQVNVHKFDVRKTLGFSILGECLDGAKRRGGSSV